MIASLRHPTDRLYGLLGARYLRFALTVRILGTCIVVLAGLGLLAVYQDMSVGDFWLIVAAAYVVLLGDELAVARRVRRPMRTARSWIRGARTDEESLEAWRCVAGLPRQVVGGRGLVAIVWNLVPVAVFVVWLLELPAYSVAVIVAGTVVVLLYGITLSFFSLELLLRPVLKDISAHVAILDGVQRRVSLRTKLLATLPAINVVTGVVVAGLSTTGQASLNDLGVDVLVAVVVAFTISLELTVLLSKSVVGPLVELREATDRIAAGDLDVRVPVLSTDETGTLAGSFNTMVAGLAEREKLREAFGTYVDPDLADRVLAEGTTLEGEEVEVSVLFVDIRDFTAFAESASAREVVAELNRFYDLIVPVLIAHGGHANKFIGDGLLGVFGAPDRRPDHADRAVAAALEMAACVRRVYGGALRIGIGVNSGPVVAGTIGGGGRLEFTVIGDPVNTAARVESVTRETGDDVLLTEATRCLLSRDPGGLLERPTVALKGKSERVRLWAPVAAAADDDERAAQRVPRAALRDG